MCTSGGLLPSSLMNQPQRHTFYLVSNSSDSPSSYSSPETNAAHSFKEQTMKFDEPDEVLQTEFDRFAGILLTLKTATVHPMTRDSAPRKRENACSREAPLQKRRKLQESANDDLDSIDDEDDECEGTDSESEEEWCSSPKTQKLVSHSSRSLSFIENGDEQWGTTSSFSGATIDNSAMKNSPSNGDEQEFTEADVTQSYEDFINAFYRLRTTRSKALANQETQGDIPAYFLGYTKRRYTNTVACSRHTLLHARCPPNCSERRPAKPHPRSKKYKLDEEDFEREEEVEQLQLSAELERKESSENRKIKKGKRMMKKSNSSSARPGRTGRKYLPQACERHKLLHARCPANCPDRIARDAESVRKKVSPQELFFSQTQTKLKILNLPLLLLLLQQNLNDF